MSLAGGGRLDCGPGMPCGHHGEAVNRFDHAPRQGRRRTSPASSAFCRAVEAAES